MTLEDELRRSVEGLAQRLKDEVARHLESTNDSVRAMIDDARTAAAAEAARDARERTEREAQDRLTVALAEVEASTRARGQEWQEEARAAGRQEGLEIGRKEGREQGRDEGRAAGREEGRAEGREEGRAEGREEGRAEGREEGFAAGLEEGRKQGLETGREQASQEATVASTGEPRGGASERLADAIRLLAGAKSLSETLDALIIAAGQEAPRAGVMLVSHDQLRSWRFVGFGPTLDDAARFEMPLPDGGIIADAVARCATVTGDSADQEVQPIFISLASGKAMTATPLVVGGEPVAVLYADQGDREPADHAWPAAIEILARYAERTLEAITAFRTAAILASRSGESFAGSGSSNGRDADRAEDLQAARRYAKLLISEIKLYHEPAVLAGQRERNLANRLAGEIARARVLYEQRVPPHVRESGDYFHAELVSTLANGNPDLLGRQAT